MIKLENFDMDEVIELMERNPNDPRWKSVAVIKQMGEMTLEEVFNTEVFDECLFTKMRETMACWKKNMKLEERKKIPKLRYDLKYYELCKYLYEMIEEHIHSELSTNDFRRELSYRYNEWSYIYEMTLYCGKALSKMFVGSNINAKDYYLAMNYLYSVFIPDKDMISMKFINRISEESILESKLNCGIEILTRILALGNIYENKRGFMYQCMIEDVFIRSVYVYAFKYEGGKNGEIHVKI